MVNRVGNCLFYFIELRREGGHKFGSIKGGCSECEFSRQEDIVINLTTSITIIK